MHYTRYQIAVKAVQSSHRELLKTIIVSLALPAFAAFLPIASTTLLAQPGSEPLSIKIPAALKVENGAQTRLPIEIIPAKAIPKRAMVLIRGMPAFATLSAGRLFVSGVWAVRPSDLAELKIAATSNSKEISQLLISLETFEGQTLSNARSTLAMVPSSNLLSTASPPPKGPDDLTSSLPGAGARDKRGASKSGDRSSASVPQTPTPRLIGPSEVAEIQALMQKGDENIRDGKVNGARLFYRLAAEKGWPEAALALAATYDEKELSRLTIVGGVEANPQLARQWYEKARDMGSAAAEERLQRLSQR